MGFKSEAATARAVLGRIQADIDRNGMEISQVGRKIDEVKTNIDRMEEDIFDDTWTEILVECWRTSRHELDQLRNEKWQLRNKEDQLRAEKGQVRNELEQLRREGMQFELWGKETVEQEQDTTYVVVE